jgi:hypothetical protein
MGCCSHTHTPMLLQSHAASLEATRCASSLSKVMCQADKIRTRKRMRMLQAQVRAHAHTTARCFWVVYLNPPCPQTVNHARQGTTSVETNGGISADLAFMINRSTQPFWLVAYVPANPPSKQPVPANSTSPQSCAASLLEGAWPATAHKRTHQAMPRHKVADANIERGTPQPRLPPCCEVCGLHPLTTQHSNPCRKVANEKSNTSATAASLL